MRPVVRRYSQGTGAEMGAGAWAQYRWEQSNERCRKGGLREGPCTLKQERGFKKGLLSTVRVKKDGV